MQLANPGFAVMEPGSCNNGTDISPKNDRQKVALHPDLRNRRTVFITKIIYKKFPEPCLNVLNTRPHFTTSAATFQRPESDNYGENIPPLYPSERHNVLDYFGRV